MSVSLFTILLCHILLKILVLCAKNDNFRPIVVKIAQKNDRNINPPTCVFNQVYAMSSVVSPSAMGFQLSQKICQVKKVF
jgi:hypothetical protein